MPEPGNIKFFKSQAEFRKWLEKNHARKDELWLGYYKKASGRASVTYHQALDEALCYGWIDGIVKGIDSEKYCQRWTPRRKGSIWSAVNIKKIKALIKSGKITDAGLKIFNERDKKRTNLYSFEQAKHELPPGYAKKFRAGKSAWENFQSMAPSYRKAAIWWVISAKKEETRLRRLDTLIQDSAAGRKLKHLVTPAKNKTSKSI